MTGTAVKVTLVPEQIVGPALLEMVTEVETVGLTVMLMLLLAAEEVVTQLSEEVSSQVTTSPLFKVAELKTLLFVPALLPFTFH